MPPLTIDDFPLAEEADTPKPLSIDDFPMASGKDLEQSVSPSRALGAVMQLMDDQEQDDPQLAVARWGHGELSKWAGRMPFLGHAFKASNSLTTARSANRIKDGKGDQRDYVNVAIYLRQQRELGNRGFGNKLLDSVLDIPGFAQEFIMTTGAFTAAKGVVGKALGGLGTGTAAKAVQAIVPSAAGVVAQTAANPTLTTEIAAANTVPDIGMTTADGEQFATIGDERSFLAALPPAFLDTMIELGSERAGGVIVGALGKIPGATRIAALKNGIVNRWLSKPGRNPGMLAETLKQAGWNGVIGEVLEERVGDVARLATGLESAEENVTGQLATGRYKEALEQLAIEGLAFSVPGAINVASRAVPDGRAERLAELKAVRAKGYVSADDGQAAGIEGETRKERLTNTDAEIQQLEQEIQNAGTVPSPEAEVRQEQGGADIRGEGQVEVPAEPAGEVAPAQSEILTSQELRDYLAQAEAAAPEASEQPEQDGEPPVPDGYVRVYHSGGPQDGGGRWVSTDKTYASDYRPDLPLSYMDIPESDPRVNNPDYAEQGVKQGFTFNFETTPEEAAKLTEIPRDQQAEQPRDVAAEIRSALTSGPVTVTTPQVQAGFQVAKVRDDGKVVTKKGRVMTPDETWEIQKPQEQPSAQPEPVREAVPPVPEAAPLPAAAAEAVPQAGQSEAAAPAKTRMDLILDEVERSGKEMNVQLEGATPDVLKRAIQAASDRGLWATTDGNNLLIRPEAPSPTAAAVEPVASPLAAEQPGVEPPAIPAPEAALPAPQTQPPDTTGTKNVKTDGLRQKAGMAERPPVEPETRDEWDSKAAKRIADDPQYAGKLAAELAAKPRALDPVEEMTLNRHLRDLENRRQSGEDVADEMATAVEASERAGTIWGRAGVSRQAERAADFSLEGIVRQHLRSVNEKPSDEQLAKYAEMADRISKLEGELNEERQKRVQAEIDKQIAESKKPEVEPAAKRPKKTTERRQAAEKKVADAWENFRKAMQTTAGSSGANLIGPAVDVAKAYVELGYVKFSEFIAEVRTNMKDADENLFRQAWVQAQPKMEPDKLDASGIGVLARKLTRWVVESGITEREAAVDAVHEHLTTMGFDLSRSETMTAISGYGEFSELSKDEVSVKIRGIKGELQQLLKLEDMQAGQAPKKTGVERREPTDEERRLIKEVNEAKKRGGYTVTDPDTQLKSALASAKTAARNRITDLEKAIAAREKIVSGQTALKADAELTDLRKRRDALNEEYRKIFPPKKNGLSDARRLKMAEKMLDRQLSDLQADLAAGRLGPKEKKAPLTSPALEEKRQQLKSLKEVREQARAASPEYQAQEAAKQNTRYKKTLERSLAFWEKRRDDAVQGKLPAKRKPTPVDDAILEKKYQIELVKRHARAEIEEAERAARGRAGKALGFGGDLLDLSRAVMTGYEMSAVLRQGAFYTLGFPKQAFPAVWKSIQAAFSRRADFALHDDLMKRPNHADYVRGGLETTASDGPLSHREELLRSRIASWLAKQQGVAAALPRWASEGLLGSERAFRSFLNTMRADLFDYMKDSVEASRPGTWSEEDAKTVAHGANVFSGRGKLPYNQSGVGWSRIFYAPRWVWSRGQLLVGEPLWKGDRATRVAIGKVYVRAALGLSAYTMLRHAVYAMLAGDDDEHEPEYELDPRSSDFGKMRVGETRIDSGAGFNQLVTLAARIITGEAKRSSGKIVPIRGDDVPYGGDDTGDVIHRFLDTKLAPLPSAVMDFIRGKNVVGEKATVGKVVGDRVTPMTWRDIWDAEKELNVPQGTVAALEAFFGAGVSTYGSRNEYRDSSEEQRKEMVAKDLKNMKWDSPEPAYGEFLTTGQLKQFDARRQEKRGLVVYNATYTGKNEDELKTRDRNREYLSEMGISFEEARDFLKDYYRRPDEKGRPGRITEGYFPKLRALKRIYDRQ